MSYSILTEKAIASATIKLISTQTINKVTVTQVCSQAGISRRSFYNHFKDLYDVIIGVFESEFFFAYKGKKNIDYFGDYFPAKCRYIYQNRAYYLQIFKMNDQNSLNQYLQKMYGEMFIDQVMVGINNPKIAALFVKSLTDITTTLIINWFETKPHWSPEQFSANYQRTCAHAGMTFSRYASKKD